MAFALVETVHPELPYKNSIKGPINGVTTTEIDGHSPSSLENEYGFDTVDDTISAFKHGQFIIVLDSPSREDEGDLIIAAEDATPEKLAFMVRHTSGLICAPLSPSLASELQLPLMVPPDHNTEMDGCAYTISVDAVHPAMTTGISAQDRALTSNMLAFKDAQPQDFRRPGHMFPLRARAGGIRERRGHTEATVEFCRLAGKRPAGVLSELVEEGLEDTESRRTEVKGAGMRRAASCLGFARKWGIRICTIESLVEYVEREGRQ